MSPISHAISGLEALPRGLMKFILNRYAVTREQMPLINTAVS
ncbi:hypothetical protein [Rickettsia endosymbiont of Polydrusus tereticollis]